MRLVDVKNETDQTGEIEKADRQTGTETETETEAETETGRHTERYFKTLGIVIVKL